MIQKRIFISVSLSILFSISSFACTLWGFAGSSVKDGGLLIAKNRDRDENSVSKLKMITPKTGHKYLAMYAVGKYDGVKGGVNEKGLVVFSASVGSVREENRLTGVGKVGKILRECATVEEIMNNPAIYLLGQFQFLLIGDKTEIIYVEISPDNSLHVERRTNGALYHTNHYLYKDFLSFNETFSTSSHKRAERVDYLTTVSSPMTLSDMITISNDKNDGWNNSIWRVGSKKSSVRTTMNMSVYVPSVGYPVVYVKTANILEEETSKQFILNAEFWQKEGFVE